MAYDWGKGTSRALSGAASGAAIGSVVPGIGTGIGALVGGGIGALGGFGGGEEEQEQSMWERMALQYFPEEYDVAPEYTETQSYLKGLGYDILGGDLPDYFKPIGEYGGPELQRVIDTTSRDITKAAETSAIARNVGRGGIATGSTMRALSSVIPQMRYEDYSRAMGVRGSLFGMGADVLTGVRGSAFDLTQSRNQWNLERFSTLLGGGLEGAGLDLKRRELEGAESAYEDEMWGQLADSAGEFATSKYGKAGGATGSGQTSSLMSNDELNKLLNYRVKSSSLSGFAT